MKRPAIDGRMFAPELTATLVEGDEGPRLCAPAVGLYRDAPLPGTRVQPGQAIGAIEILGVSHRVLAPAEAGGLVREASGPRLARRPVEFGAVLVSLDPNALGALADDASAPGAAAGGAAHHGLRVPSPLSGRYYARPSPDQPAFVAVGDVVDTGQTIALLEVMKTFNRITYGGDGLPARGRVVAIVPADGDDVDEGDPLLEVEPAP